MQSHWSLVAGRWRSSLEAKACLFEENSKQCLMIQFGKLHFKFLTHPLVLFKHFKTSDLTTGAHEPVSEFGHVFEAKFGSEERS